MTMNEFQRQMALAEYRQLVESGAIGAMQFAQDPEAAIEQVKKKARRKKSAYSRALSRELKAINKQARTKSGKLRKGMTQKKILQKAHRAVKRRLK
tara:strand:- start:224 stop:511 length:288 start_codon:yes stop_codon:yes gene_type:complete